MPDLPGCVAVDETVEEVEQVMHEAIERHLVGMREHGDPVPPPVVQVNYIDLAA